MESTISFSSVVEALRRMTSRIWATSMPFNSAPCLAKKSMQAIAPGKFRCSTAVLVVAEKALTAPFASSANCSPISASAAAMLGFSVSNSSWICDPKATLSISISFPRESNSPTASRRHFRRRSTKGTRDIRYQKGLFFATLRGRLTPPRRTENRERRTERPCGAMDEASVQSVGSGENGNRKDARGARTASDSIGRSAASPLTATAALRFAPCQLEGRQGPGPFTVRRVTPLYRAHPSRLSVSRESSNSARGKRGNRKDGLEVRKLGGLEV